MLEKSVWAGANLTSYEFGSAALSELAEVSLSAKQIRRMTSQIGGGRVAERQQFVAEFAAKTLVERILASGSHPQEGYRPCLGIMRLGKHFGPERLEAACRRALAINSVCYKSVESILKNNLDKRPLPQKKADSPTIQHEHLRGAQYYEDDKETQGEPSPC